MIRARLTAAQNNLHAAVLSTKVKPVATAIPGLEVDWIVRAEIFGAHFLANLLRRRRLLPFLRTTGRRRDGVGRAGLAPELSFQGLRGTLKRLRSVGCDE